MDYRELPSLEVLHKLLRYEPVSGKLFWRERTPEMFTDGYRTAIGNCANWNANNSNKEALGCKNANGHKHGAINHVRYLAHRVVWTMVYGRAPDMDIDHINHDPSDNRIKNIREVTRSENQRNMSMRKDNKSGVCGVRRNPTQKISYNARIGDTYLGSFGCITAAAVARKVADKQLNYHENHGEK